MLLPLLLTSLIFCNDGRKSNLVCTPSTRCCLNSFFFGKPTGSATDAWSLRNDSWVGEFFFINVWPFNIFGFWSAWSLCVEFNSRIPAHSTLYTDRSSGKNIHIRWNNKCVAISILISIQQFNSILNHIPLEFSFVQIPFNFLSSECTLSQWILKLYLLAHVMPQLAHFNLFTFGPWRRMCLRRFAFLDVTIKPQIWHTKCC